MIRGKKCTHVVPISKANNGPGCYCQPFISGALGSCLRFDEVWLPFLFPRQACGIHHLWERLVFISRRHFPRRAICGKKKKEFRGWRGNVFKSCHCKDLSSQSAILTPSFWFLSLFIHCIFNLSHKAHYSPVPAAIAVRLSELLAIHSTPLQYP